MSKLQKLVQKILDGRDISYEEAEGLLLKLGFELEVRGSHHIFRGDTQETSRLSADRSCSRIRLQI